MSGRDLVYGSGDENDIDLYEEKKKLPFAVKMVLLGIAAIAVIAIVIYAYTWYKRPTVEVLQAYNNLQNLLYEKNSMYLHNEGSDGTYLIMGDAYMQTAMFYNNSEKYSADLEYDGKRYVVGKDGESVYCFLSQFTSSSVSKNILSMHFSGITPSEYNKRPSVKDGKYVYVLEKKIGSNTLKTKFVFNKDMSVSQIYMDDILIQNIEYGVQKDAFAPLEKYDLKDTAKVNFINMYDPSVEYKTYNVPKGMGITGTFLSFNPNDPDAERPSEPWLGIYLDKECTIPIDETTKIEENTTLYLNLLGDDQKVDRYL